MFPEAQQLQFLDTSYFAVKDAENEVIGSVLLSSPYSDGVKGYAGKTPLLIALDNEDKIMQIKLLANHETPGFIKRLMKSGYLESWNGLSVDEALQKNVDAVSGATYSSKGIQNSLKARLAVVARQNVVETTDNSALFTKYLHSDSCHLGFDLLFQSAENQNVASNHFIAFHFDFRLLAQCLNVAAEILQLAHNWHFMASGMGFDCGFALAVLLPLFTRKAFIALIFARWVLCRNWQGKPVKRSWRFQKQ